ncbi:MAG: hypothetical protein ABFD10_23410, partial [Prolixibacteraceae bacterium]
TPLAKTIALYLPATTTESYSQIQELLGNLTRVGWYSLGFVALSSVIYLLRTRFANRHRQSAGPTWGCGYTGDTAKMQYTASSFIRTYRKLAEPVLFIKKHKKDAAGLYPDRIEQETHPGDWIETLLIDKPILFSRKFLRHFGFLQNGNIQAYILYGFIFISVAVLLPLIVSKIGVLIEFLNHL